MKSCRSIREVLFLSFFLLLASGLLAQSTGYINRPATGAAGRAVLDPNGDGYTSATTAGFEGSDVLNSEIAYKSIPSFSSEPFGDLRRGPNHLYSDFVPDNGDDGVYAAFDGSNLLFRFRIGTIMPGSKGYSVLLDTDGKFGATGVNADPNYQEATTGTNGNPGFEIEIVLETNFRIAIYNVDGTSNPTFIKAYTNWQDYSQISIAATSDNGDPDFLMDFYVPFSDLEAAPFNLNTASPIRFSATTVMAPTSAIGGPKSDIYGLNDSAFTGANEQYEAYIEAQAPFTADDLAPGGSGPGPMCTAPPEVNSPVSVGTVTISGTWTHSTLTGAVTTATITVYRNNTIAGTVPDVASGAAWSLTGVTTVAGDVITARAQATGESMCLVSNAVVATNCNSNTRPEQPTGFCGDRKGFSGTNYPAGAVINLYRLTSTGQTLVASGAIGAAGFASDGAVGWTLSGGCAAGGGSYTGGTYLVYFTLNGCDSKAAFACANNTQAGWTTSATAAPVIDQANVYTSTTTISGTAEAGSMVRLYVDDLLEATPVLSGTSWSYTFSRPLALGQVVMVTAQLPDNNTTKVYACTGSASRTVTCYSTVPLLTTNAAGQLLAGQPVSGTSSEPAGALVRVYTTGATLVATTPVQADGTWSTANAGTTPAAYNAVAGTSYYATAQNGSCAVSNASSSATAFSATPAARCGSITGPVTASATGISGTLSGSVAGTQVNLYLDGMLIGTTTTGTTDWGPIAVNTTIDNTLYPNGVLTIGVQESGMAEAACPASATTISCAPTPTAPSISPTSTVVSRNQNVTYTVSNAATGTFYGLADAASGASMGTGAWATSDGSLSLTTWQLSTSQTYNILVKATSVSGATMCTSPSTLATVVVSSTLPARLLDFRGSRNPGGTLLTWTAAEEEELSHYEVERSQDGLSYRPIGRRAATGSATTATYSFTDAALFSGTAYYRLRITDKDGSFRYSAVVVVRGGQSFTATLFPNPVQDELTLEVSLDRERPLLLELVDSRGAVVRSFRRAGLKGPTRWTVSGLGRLPAGLYLARLTAGDLKLQQKVMKQ